MTKETLTLSELNYRVKNAIQNHLPDSYWLRAETGDVRRNQNGHCYLEFVEKDLHKQHIVAKARGIIWSNVSRCSLHIFEAETGRYSLRLNAGVKPTSTSCTAFLLP